MIKLRDKEKLIRATYQHKSVIMGPVLSSLIFSGIILAGVILFPHSLWGYKNYVLAGIAAVFLLVILQKFYVWRKNILYITNQRVIYQQQKGLFSRAVTELLYRDIHELRFVQKGISALLHNYGTIYVVSPSAHKIAFEKIPDPSDIVGIINKARTDELP